MSQSSPSLLRSGVAASISPFGGAGLDGVPTTFDSLAPMSGKVGDSVATFRSIAIALLLGGARPCSPCPTPTGELVAAARRGHRSLSSSARLARETRSLLSSQSRRAASRGCSSVPSGVSRPAPRGMGPEALPLITLLSRTSILPSLTSTIRLPLSPGIIVAMMTTSISNPKAGHLS